MGALRKTRTTLQAIAERWRRPAFSCADCERNAQCGRPPTADCTVKLAHLERDPTGYEQRIKARSAILKSGFWA